MQQQLGNVGLLLGVVSLVIAVVSRLSYTPVLGVSASAIVMFAQACFLLSIAASLTSCKK